MPPRIAAPSNVTVFTGEFNVLNTLISLTNCSSYAPFTELASIDIESSLCPLYRLLLFNVSDT